MRNPERIYLPISTSGALLLHGLPRTEFGGFVTRPTAVLQSTRNSVGDYTLMKCVAHPEQDWSALCREEYVEEAKFQFWCIFSN
jgi:hypothetical protein